MVLCGLRVSKSSLWDASWRPLGPLRASGSPGTLGALRALLGALLGSRQLQESPRKPKRVEVEKPKQNLWFFKVFAFKSDPREPKTVSRGLQDGPRQPQEKPRVSQESPRQSQESSRQSQESSRQFEESARQPQLGRPRLSWAL